MNNSSNNSNSRSKILDLLDSISDNILTSVEFKSGLSKFYDKLSTNNIKKDSSKSVTDFSKIDKQLDEITKTQKSLPKSFTKSVVPKKVVDIDKKTFKDAITEHKDSLVRELSRSNESLGYKIAEVVTDGLAGLSIAKAVDVVTDYAEELNESYYSVQNYMHMTRKELKSFKSQVVSQYKGNLRNNYKGSISSKDFIESFEDIIRHNQLTDSNLSRELASQLSIGKKAFGSGFSSNDMRSLIDSIRVNNLDPSIVESSFAEIVYNQKRYGLSAESSLSVLNEVSDILALSSKNDDKYNKNIQGALRSASIFNKSAVDFSDTILPLVEKFNDTTNTESYRLASFLGKDARHLQHLARSGDLQAFTSEVVKGLKSQYGKINTNDYYSQDFYAKEIGISRRNLEQIIKMDPKELMSSNTNSLDKNTVALDELRSSINEQHRTLSEKFANDISWSNTMNTITNLVSTITTVPGLLGGLKGVAGYAGSKGSRMFRGKLLNLGKASSTISKTRSLSSLGKIKSLPSGVKNINNFSKVKGNFSNISKGTSSSSKLLKTLSSSTKSISDSASKFKTSISGFGSKVKTFSSGVKGTLGGLSSTKSTLSTVSKSASTLSKASSSIKSSLALGSTLSKGGALVSKAGGVVGKALPALSVGLTTFDAVSDASVVLDKNSSTSDKVKGVSSGVTKGAGMIIGGLLGSLAGPGGTLVGASVGGMIGDAIAGPVSSAVDWIGQKLFGYSDDVTDNIQQSVSDSGLSSNSNLESMATMVSKQFETVPSLINYPLGPFTNISTELFFELLSNSIDRSKLINSILKSSNSMNSLQSSGVGGGVGDSSSSSLSGSFTDGLGFISTKYEVGSKADPGSISNDSGDYGGKSYGLSQFSTTTGSANGFVKWLKDKNPNLGKFFNGAGSAGSSSFDKAWKSANSYDSKAFGNMQKLYTYEHFVLPFMNKAKKEFGVDLSRSRALQEMAYSIAVQHGMNGTYALGNINNKMSDREIVDHVYNYKYNNVGRHFRSSSASIQKGVANRIKNEHQDILQLLNAPKIDPYQSINSNVNRDTNRKMTEYEMESLKLQRQTVANTTPESSSKVEFIPKKGSSDTEWWVGNYLMEFGGS